jgi:hypothetical protein
MGVSDMNIRMLKSTNRAELARVPFRDKIALCLVPIMVLTGFRFSKAFRQAENGWKKLIYTLINVVLANVRSDMIAYRIAVKNYNDASEFLLALKSKQ